MKFKIGFVVLVVTALILFSACSPTAAPTTAPLPPQVNTDAAPTDLSVSAAPTDEPTVAAATDEPTQAAPTDAPSAPTVASTPAAPAVSNDSGGAGIPIGNIDDVLNKACAAQQAQTNITAHLVFTGSSTADTTVQVAGTDRAHLMGTENGTTSEEIILPTGLYQKEDGKWGKMELPGAGGRNWNWRRWQPCGVWRGYLFALAKMRKMGQDSRRK